MFKPSEEDVRLGLQQRAQARSRLFQSLLADSPEFIRTALTRRGLPIRDESQLTTACRIVDAEYPDAIGPETSDPNLGVPMQNPDATIQAVPVDASAYPDVAGYTPERERVDIETGGFSAYELALADENQRAFVGFRDQNGTVIKLMVSGVLNLSGFDLNATDQSRVIIVDLPSWWIDASYVEKWTASVLDAALTGEPEKVIDVVNNLCGEQSWDAHVLHRQYFGDDTPLFADAATEQFNRPADLRDVTQANPVIEPNEQAPNDSGDWIRGGN